MTPAHLLPIVSILDRLAQIDKPLRQRFCEVWMAYLDQLERESEDERRARLTRLAERVTARASGTTPPRETELAAADMFIPNLPGGPASLDLIIIDEDFFQLPRSVWRKCLALVTKWDAPELASLTPADRRVALVEELRDWYDAVRPSDLV